MKGIVFVEFLEMTEKEFGLNTVQSMIDGCDLDSKGIYTSVGTYSHKEFFEIVDKISELKGIEKDKILIRFGEYFLNVASKNYPDFFKTNNVFKFLEYIDNYIHPNVLKLYPEAQLPRFEHVNISSSQMKLRYFSSRKMSKFAEGLIVGAGKFFNQKLNVVEEKSFKGGEEVLLNITYAK